MPLAVAVRRNSRREMRCSLLSARFRYSLPFASPRGVGSLLVCGWSATQYKVIFTI
jgi:hypothetical protein